VFGFELNRESVEAFVKGLIVIWRRGVPGCSARAEEARDVAEQADEQLAGLGIDARGFGQFGVKGCELITQI
jgi:hypothetical protein